METDGTEQPKGLTTYPLFRQMDSLSPTKSAYCTNFNRFIPWYEVLELQRKRAGKRFRYYLGLLPTWKESGGIPEDYCADTQKYFGNDAEGYKKNTTAYKLVKDCFFLAENIMDDPLGTHRSVSLQQSQRIRWILNNCPERSAWKSNFAFTGK
ncbi:MAG: hypothetical protein ACLU4N_12320 [Butyricimonas faecihominis]